MLIIYNRLKSQICLLPYQYIHLCTRSIIRYVFRQIAFYLCRSYDTIAFIIQMCMNNIFPSNLHFHLLLTERNKQVFHQSPIQKCSELIYPSNFQTSKLSHLHQRGQCSGNQSLIYIQIEKYIQHISYLTAFGHITGR